MEVDNFFVAYDRAGQTLSNKLVNKCFWTLKKITACIGIRPFVQLTEVASFFECDLKLTSSKDLTVLAWVGLDTISEIYEKVEILSIFFIVEFF